MGNYSPIMRRLILASYSKLKIFITSVALYLLFYFVTVSIVVKNLLLAGNHSLIGNSYEGGVYFWITWFPTHAIRFNYDINYNHYSLYPIDQNWLSLTSLPTSLIYALFNLGVSELQSFNLLFWVYLILIGITGFSFANTHIPDKRYSLLVGSVLILNPLTFSYVKHGEISLLGFFGLLLWMVNWNSYVKDPNPKRFFILILLTYLVLLMSIQFWNISITLLLPYAVFQSRRRWQEKNFIDSIILGVLIVFLLCFLHPFPAIIRSTYLGKYHPVEVLHGNIATDVLGLRVLLILLFLGVALTLVLQRNIDRDQRWWVGIIVCNSLCAGRIDIAPLSLLSGIFDIPHLSNLTQNSIFLLTGISVAIVFILKGIEEYFRGLNSYLQWLCIILILSFCVLVSGWLQGFPVTKLASYKFYETISDEPEDYTVVDFPLAVGSVLKSSEFNEANEFNNLFNSSYAGMTQAYAPIHHKKVLGGLTGFVRAEEWANYTTPFVRMITFQSQQIPDEEAVPLIRTEVLRNRIGYIVIHPSNTPADFVDALRGWLVWTGTFCHVGNERDIEIWRAYWHPLGCPSYTISLNSRAGIQSTHFEESGWHESKYSDGELLRWSQKTAQMQLWAIPNNNYQLKLRIKSPLPQQTVDVIANGKLIDTLSLNLDWQEYILQLPHDTVLSNGLLQITLQHSKMTLSQDEELAAIYDYVSLELIE